MTVQICICRSTLVTNPFHKTRGRFTQTTVTLVASTGRMGEKHFKEMSKNSISLFCVVFVK